MAECLVVQLEEHEVLGNLGEDGRLISTQGDVFTANLAEAEDDAKLVKLSGPEGSEKKCCNNSNCSKKWFEVLKLNPEEVQLSSRYAWSVFWITVCGLTSDGCKMLKLKARVDQLARVYPQLTTRLGDKILNIDMRYPNGLALKTSLPSKGNGTNGNRRKRIEQDE